MMVTLVEATKPLPDIVTVLPRLLSAGLRVIVRAGTVRVASPTRPVLSSTRMVWIPGVRVAVALLGSVTVNTTLPLLSTLISLRVMVTPSTVRSSASAVP